jgi:hypothetical protein
MERALSVFGQDKCLCAFRACVWLVLLARCRQALDKSDIPTNEISRNHLTWRRDQKWWGGEGVRLIFAATSSHPLAPHQPWR